MISRSGYIRLFWAKRWGMFVLKLTPGSIWHCGLFILGEPEVYITMHDADLGFAAYQPEKHNQHTALYVTIHRRLRHTDGTGTCAQNEHACLCWLQRRLFRFYRRRRNGGLEKDFGDSHRKVAREK